MRRTTIIRIAAIVIAAAIILAITWPAHGQVVVYSAAPTAYAPSIITGEPIGFVPATRTWGPVRALLFGPRPYVPVIGTTPAAVLQPVVPIMPAPVLELSPPRLIYGF